MLGEIKLKKKTLWRNYFYDQMKEADILPILMKYFKVYRGKDQNYKNIFYCCDELVKLLENND